MNKQQLQEALDRFESGIGITNEDVDLIEEAARAYAELPEKLRGMKVDKHEISPIPSEYDRADGYNQAIDDILKEIEG